MRILKPTLIMLVLCVCVTGVVRAEDKKEQQPATTAPAGGETIDATNIDKLKESVGKTVTVRGLVEGVFVARSGRVLINFLGAERNFVGMISKENADAVKAGFNGDLAKALDGTTIHLSGEVKLFKENPQIEITKQDQIKIVAPKEEAPAEEDTEEKKPQ